MHPRWWSASCHGWPLQRNTCDRKSGDLLFGSKKWLKIRGIIWEFLLLAVIMNLMISYGYILWLSLSMYFPFSDPNKIEVYSDALGSSRPAERAFDLFRTLRWSSGGFGGGQGTTPFGNRKQRQNRWYRLISVDILISHMECVTYRAHFSWM